MSVSAAAIRYQSLAYVALNVTDLERSKTYYRDMVGLMPSGEALGAAFFRCSDRHHDVMLSQADVSGLKRIGWLMESAAQTALLRAHIEGLGHETRSVAPDECAVLTISEDAFRFREPNSGATFEFFSSMAKADGPFVPTLAKIARLGHVVLGVKDLPAAESFFLEKLNFRASDRIDGMVTFMRAFPNPFHHILGLSQADENKLHHVNFMVTEVDDIGKANNRFKKNGVPIVFGPGRHPPSDSMFFYFVDPDGHWNEYSFGMEEFPEVGARDPRRLPAGLESIDYWGSIPDSNFPQKGVIEAFR
jgi:2,3-dihydroxy-p-cumate/2,3-dihydroxybenzoate 3,4-dioxygenase